MNYQKQAENFLEQTGTKLKWEYLKHDKYWHEDKVTRDIYKFTLTRNKKRYSGTFGQSIADFGKIPTAYALLSCLTKSDPCTFENFCSDFGYDTDSRNAEKTYKAVIKEWQGVNKLFGDVLEQLAEIQ